MGANFGIAGMDWQQRVNWDRLRKYRTERARAMEAVGDYRGERIEAKGSSADVAAKWVEAARFKDS